MTTRTHGTRRRRQGMTLLELSISISIMAIVVFGMVVSVEREADGLSSMVDNTVRQRQAHEILQRLESELEFAAATIPTAFLQTNVHPGSKQLRLDNAQGFPPQGVVLLNPSGAQPARFRYAGLDPSLHTLVGLKPLDHCNKDHHTAATGQPAHWAGIASAIDNQVNPTPDQFEGQALEMTGPVFFRGFGTGFSFRLPTDPTGGTSFFSASGVNWGSSVEGAPSLQGWSAIDFRPNSQVSEAALSIDVNLDGDLDDDYDLGFLRLQSWNAFASGSEVSDVALGAPIILQERCNHGGDLDGDGFADPIFLWNADGASLTVRLTVLSGAHRGRPRIRRLQSTVFLRNGEAN